MSSPQTARRPVLVTITMVLVYLTGLLDAAVGTLILLSRYEVPDPDVLIVSLVGAAVILFGLLALAVAGGIGHGSRLARLLVTVYAALQLGLNAVTIVGTDWDWSAWVSAALDVLILAALWIPPSSRAHFRAFDPLRGSG